MKNIIMKHLSVELIDDYFDFFDHRAFEDNPAWGGCYCVFFHHDGDEADWLRRSKEENRSLAEKLIREGTLRGFLAYEGAKVVGWCNANDKKVFSFGKNRAGANSTDEEGVVSIVCFVVYHAERGRGISRELLRTVMNGYRGSGKRYLEAYPLNDDSRGIPYHGPKSLYLNNGFILHRDLGDYCIVRYSLM